MQYEVTATFQAQSRIPRATIVHHVDAEGAVYLTHGRKILKVADGVRSYLGCFPRIIPRDLFNFSRLSQRAARSDKCNVYMNGQGQLLGIRGESVYAIRSGKFHKLQSIQGDCVLHDGFAEDDEGWTYFGEYFRNPERGPVRIWRVDPGLQTCEVAHEFPSGDIRHVHGVFRDPYDSGAMWVSVGDLRDECYLLRTDDRFQSLQRFGEGTQTWRAVKLFFTPTHVTWITDSNLEQNHACRMDRLTGKLEVGQEVDCSGWYGFQTENGEFVAGTTVEVGPGIHSDYSSLLVSNDGFHWHVAHRFRKDIFRPMRVFKYGVINFPSGKLSLDDFYLSGEGLSSLDGKVIRATVRMSQEHAHTLECDSGSNLSMAGTEHDTRASLRRAG